MLEISDLGADCIQFLTHPQNQNQFCVILWKAQCTHGTSFPWAATCPVPYAPSLTDFLCIFLMPPEFQSNLWWKMKPFHWEIAAVLYSKHKRWGEKLKGRQVLLLIFSLPWLPSHYCILFIWHFRDKERKVFPIVLLMRLLTSVMESSHKITSVFAKFETSWANDLIWTVQPAKFLLTLLGPYELNTELRPYKQSQENLQKALSALLATIKSTNIALNAAITILVPIIFNNWVWLQNSILYLIYFDCSYILSGPKSPSKYWGEEEEWRGWFTHCNSVNFGYLTHPSPTFWLVFLKFPLSVLAFHKYPHDSIHLLSKNFTETTGK